MSLNLENLQQSAYVDGQGGLHIVPVNDTKMIHFSLSSFSADSLQTSLDVTSSPLHSKVIKKTFIQSGVICFIDEADDLYLYDVSKKSKVYIRNIGELYRKYGNFMNVFPFYDDILITLHTGGIEESQAEMISNIFDFDDIEVREVMTHRTEMVAIEENSTLSEAVKLVIGEGFSRIPVYCDNADNISGVIFAKDLLRLVFEEDKKERPVKEFMRDITFVPESNKCGELFKEFTEDKTQIAVVVDDYGGTAGIITMEDLLETIVGSIQDEYDDETEEIQKVSSDCYDMVGTAAFDDVMEALGKEYHGEVDYDTIGGFVMDLLGHVPEDNEKVTVHWENVEFKVLSIHEKKIERLRAVIKRDNEEVTD
jgi:Mg2+/Co2+ transporter CorC